MRPHSPGPGPSFATSPAKDGHDGCERLGKERLETLRYFCRSLRQRQHFFIFGVMTATLKCCKKKHEKE